MKRRKRKLSSRRMERKKERKRESEGEIHKSSRGQRGCVWGGEGEIERKHHW
jgi:hypothetical protein